MIDDNTAEQAALYVMGLLKGEDLADFEEALRASDDLRSHVNELSAGLYEPFKSAGPRARPDLLDGILARVDPGVAPAANAFVFPWAYFWGTAAALFLGLNLILLLLLNGRDPGPSLAGPDPDNPGQLANLSPDTGDSPQANEMGAVLATRVERLEAELGRAREHLLEFESERDQLLQENAEVKEFNSEWQREYALLAARFLPFFETQDGLGRFTVIEMVDAEAFAQDLPRRGFAELAGQFLTGEGNIAGIGPEDFVGPVVEGAGASAAQLDPSRAGLAPVPGSTMPLGEEPAGDVNAKPPVEASSARPTGFTVWRDDEQKGFLDVYNLPLAPEGREAFLWVRSSDLEDYIPVGKLPDLDNGTGSLFYSVEEPNFTPSEILITAEGEGESASVPSGTVLLRGP